MYILTKLFAQSGGLSLSTYSEKIGEQIKLHRKLQGLTLQELADAIYKSRASVSKYENGSITLDVDTLRDISRVLNVSVSQLLDVEQEEETQPVQLSAASASPFFEASTFYFYYYDGRFKKLKNGLINVAQKNMSGEHMASLTIKYTGANGRTSTAYYNGKVVYSDMLIRFSFVNRYNPLEEDLLYIFNPLEFRDSTVGLLCGISSVDLQPCAYKCLVSLTPQEATEELKTHLLFNKKEMQYWKRQNIFIVDNSLW